MKRYNITVNGKTYVVEVEDAGGANVSAPAAPAAAAPVAAAPAAAPKAAAAPAPAAPAPAAAPTAGDNVIVAPMPGTILSVEVSEGSAVKKGQVLVMLEAMKMENEIMAPADGVVKQVSVTKGASVDTGDVLVVM